MAYIKNVTILDANQIRIDQDAQSGDIINLQEINQVDISLIIKKMDEAKDVEYEKRLNALRHSFEIEKENALAKHTKALEDDITILKEQLLKQTKEVEQRLNHTFSIDKQDLIHQIQILKNEKESLLKQKTLEINEAILHKEKETNEKLSKLNQQLSSFEMQKKYEIEQSVARLKLEIEKAQNALSTEQKAIEYLKNTQEKEVIIAVQKRESELKETINELEDKISALQLTKSLLNIKQLGEGLETWCNNEYELYALSGFETCSWDKDNKVVKDLYEIKGSKADYIFKVYATAEKKQEELLTSIACEMKSEDSTSSKRTRNSDHYKKLDLDRQKKQCEYALLVSELEMDASNDSPIKKVIGYDKMYVVRPQYFIVFLSVVTALGLKYKDILLEENQQRAQFKDSEDILTEFEDMKQNILDNSLKHLETEVGEIFKHAESIHTLSKKILESATTIIEKRLSLVRKKIDTFNITKVTKKIDKIV